MRDHGRVSSGTSTSQIMQWVAEDYPNDERQWTLETGDLARQFGVGCCVYEGGAHVNNLTGNSSYDDLFIQTL